MIQNRKLSVGALSVLALAALALFAKVHVRGSAPQPSTIDAPPAVTISKI